MGKNILIGQLNSHTKAERVAAVKELKKMLDKGDLAVPVRKGYTNNHVHTKYSFSPYSPAAAVWTAYMSGLATVGIIDHDAINGAEEFTEAGKILGIATTVGFEMRTDWTKTSLNGKYINNPDQVSNAYITAHGLPHTQITKADAFLSKIRCVRSERNIEMVQRLNDIMMKHGISIDYVKDVVPLSYSESGGEITERHLLFALAKRIICQYGTGEKLLAFINNNLKIRLNDQQRKYLKDINSGMYEYDLLNILKGNFIPQIYIDASQEETPPVAEVVAFINRLGAIPTYCYLGDIEKSPTGDKKAQKFEDDYLEDLFAECKSIGFRAIAYMPSRNTLAQLERLITLCERYGFLQINGEDINQPRQSFVCKQLLDPRFAHLTETAWALVGHEISATSDISKGMFANDPTLMSESLHERIQKYMAVGRRKYNNLS